MGERALAELSHCGRNCSAAVGAEWPCAYGVVRARPLCLSGVRLGPTGGRSPTSLAELTTRREPHRVEVRLQLPRVDGLPCRVQAVGLRREHVVQHVLWAPADASARARVETDAPEQHSRYTPRGVHVFFFGFGAQEYTLGDETEEGWPRGGFIA